MTMASPRPKLINQRFPEGWDEERVQRLLADLDSRTEEEWVAADEAAASEHDDQVVVTVPVALLPEIRRLLAAYNSKPARTHVAGWVASEIVTFLSGTSDLGSLGKILFRQMTAECCLDHLFREDRYELLISSRRGGVPGKLNDRRNSFVSELIRSTDAASRKSLCHCRLTRIIHEFFR
jgi:hypothetical protein